MQPRDLFDVAVRAAGVFALLWGLWDLANSALFYTGYFEQPGSSFRYYLIFGWCSIIIGLLMIRSAGVLVNFAYPEEIAEDETEGQAQNNS